MDKEKCTTAEQFEADYAARSGTTVELLHAWGRYAEPCDCEDDLCEGWAMGHQWEEALFEGRIRAGVPGKLLDKTGWSAEEMARSTVDHTARFINRHAH